MRQPESLGRIAKDYLADMILVNGNPLENIRILQDRTRLLAIVKDGAFHKRPATPQASVAA